MGVGRLQAGHRLSSVDNVTGAVSSAVWYAVVDSEG